MELVDVHCHLDETFYKDDIDEVIKRCKENNCLAFPVGVDPETNRYVLKLKEKYPDTIFPCLGIYPRDALTVETNENFDYDIDKEIKFIEENKDKIVAIGEVGMDFKNGKNEKQQEKEFRKMIELAMKLDKPLVIHSRKAEKKVIDILEEYKFRKIVMHCFGGKHSQVKRIRENKWYFSIPTNIVRDQHFQKLVKETPMMLLLTETDSPFLSPFRNEKNQPINVIETIKKIAEIKRLPEKDVATIIRRNTKILFGI